MPNINRDNSPSQQRISFDVNPGATATGATGIICLVPTPCNLDYVGVAAFGVSNLPTVQVNVQRFIVGTGYTTFQVSGANILGSYGTSGPCCLVGASVLAKGASIPTIGNTLPALLQGDILQWQIGGANAAVTGFVAHAVLRPVQDIVQYFQVL